MNLYLVPCNAMARGGYCAEDRGLIQINQMIYLAMSGQDHSENHVGGIPHTANAMRLYTADHDIQHHAWAKHGADQHIMKLKILLSYHYYKNTDLDTLFTKYFGDQPPEVFADSGAFSAMSQGAPIDIDEYAAWVKRWQHLFTTYANLDVIGNAIATQQNQDYLEQQHGLSPLPVFHTGSDFAHLERLIDRYPYIALGGMVPHMRFPKRIMPWLVKCFRLAQGRSVFHGFGATSWVIVSSLAWYSVDSSSWGSGFRFGLVPVFDGRKGKFYDLQLGDVKKWAAHGALVREFGFDPLDFADRSRNDRAKICAISALSYLRAEQWLRKRHGEIRIPMRENTGLRLHLVTANNPGSNQSVDTLADSLQQHGIRLHLSDTSNGVNLGDTNDGINIFLADSTPASSFDVGEAKRVLDENDSNH